MLLENDNELLAKPSEKKPEVVYGVYDAAGQPFAQRFEDFFIDRKRVKIEEKSYFYHLLAVMLDAGIPILKCLKILSKKTENPRFARIVNTLAYDVEHGKKLSQSMTKFPDVFPEEEVGVVRSGESIGNMSGLLFRIADQTERVHALYMKVRGALIYPATVLIALAVSAFIVVQVVIPRLEVFFVDSNVEMPWLTNVVLTMGRFLVDYSGFVILGIFVLGLLFSFYKGTPSGARRWDAWLLSTIWVKDLVRKYNVAKFVQILSLLVEAGVPIHEAIRIASGAVDNHLYKEFLNALRHNVERGEKIAENLAKAPFLFPETVTAMVSVGENTGQLSLIADKLAQHYEREVENSLDNFTTILEPIVIVVVGLAVGVLAIALLGPIFSLSSLV